MHRGLRRTHVRGVRRREPRRARRARGAGPCVRCAIASTAARGGRERLVMTLTERVLVLKGADLLKDVGPRHLLGLADLAREVSFTSGDLIFREEDPAETLYMVVEG